MKEIILTIHPTFAMLGVLASVWILVETLNISQFNISRIRNGSIVVSLFMFIAWISSGYWYVLYYATDKALILAGPWAFAHSLVMETKEHLFFMTLVLTFFLPIIAFKEDLVTSKSARVLLITVSALVILSALALEGAGSIIALGVKVGLLNAAGMTY